MKKILRRIPAVMLSFTIAITATISSGIAGVATAPAASAVDYPSWNDVQAAKTNTEQAAKAVTDITALIAKLTNDAEVARVLAQQRADEFFVAQQKYDDAVRHTADIQAQADAAAAKAAAATKAAAQVAALLYQTGGVDVTLEIFFDSNSSNSAEDLLAKLAGLDNVISRTSEIYRTAEEQKNTAVALGQQAEVARKERETLRLAAETALAKAQAAQADAEVKLAESEAKKGQLQAQLAFLQDTQAKTTAAYEEGERIRAEAERKRKEAEEAARREAERIAREQYGNNGAGEVVSSGWSLPAAGSITDGFGSRPVWCGGGYCTGDFHYGVDIGTGCGRPIYAANSGMVTYSGWSDSYGNYIKINHGGGVSSAYAHIVDGGRLVGYGDTVVAGQQIAWSGTTGASTGCHLHFEIWIGGGRINPIPFMADRGIQIG